MAYSWAKVYIEVIDDRKIADLPDSLWRLYISLLMIAGDKKSDLPNQHSLPEIAWILHRPCDSQLLNDIAQLEKAGLVSPTQDELINVSYVTKTKDQVRGRDRNDPRYTGWRTSVFNRDNYKCQLCGVGGYVIAHHINSWSKFPDERFDIENGITLCRDCHKREHRHRS